MERFGNMDNTRVQSSLSCRRVQRLLESHGLDGIPEHLALAVEEHVAVCPTCGSIAEKTSKVIASLNQLGNDEGELPRNFKVALKQRILNASAEEEVPVVPAEVAAPKSVFNTRNLVLSAACLVFFVVFSYTPTTQVDQRTNFAQTEIRRAPVQQVALDLTDAPETTGSIEANAQQVHELQPGESIESALRKVALQEALRAQRDGKRTPEQRVHPLRRSRQPEFQTVKATLR